MEGHVRRTWNFAKGEQAPTNLSTINEVNRENNTLKAIHEKAVYGASEVEVLLQWLVERYNCLAFHQTDPTEFIDNDLVDFVSSFEHALSLDRILRKGMSCAVSAESVSRKEAAMEIADIIGELACYWGVSTYGAEHFKKLVHPVDGRSLIRLAFKSAPAPFSDLIPDVADSIYDSLQASIVESVFIQKRKPRME